MKNQLPESHKIAKESKETVQETVSEFISFITSEASDKCMQEKRKTINGDDLLWAMSTLGFDRYVEPLKVYLAKYREAVRGDKPEKSSSPGGGGGGGGGVSIGRPPATSSSVGDGVGVPPSNKRVKTEEEGY
jgi:nuclear transcription Y subunit beta